WLAAQIFGDLKNFLVGRGDFQGVGSVGDDKHVPGDVALRAVPSIKARPVGLRYHSAALTAPLHIVKLDAENRTMRRPGQIIWHDCGFETATPTSRTSGRADERFPRGAVLFFVFLPISRILASELRARCPLLFEQ